MNEALPFFILCFLMNEGANLSKCDLMHNTRYHFAARHHRQSTLCTPKRCIEASASTKQKGFSCTHSIELS